jgi:hypothetical protein
MSSEKRAGANRGNAGRSTGPRSAAGKAKASKNALAHGLTSALPVLPGEPADAWERHRAGVLAGLRPAGTLEESLAERVAGCLWRLRRVVAYETAVTVAGLEEAADPPAVDEEFLPLAERTDTRRLRKAEKDLTSARELIDTWADTTEALEKLSDLPDDAPLSGSAVEGVFSDLNGALPNGDEEYFEYEDAKFLAELGVPKGFIRAPYEWEGWTAGLVRKAAAAAAAEFDQSPEFLLARARDDRRQSQREQEEKVARLECEVRDLRDRTAARRRRAVIRRAIPDGDTLEKVSRYEAHLSRQMLQALHTLERLQAGRAGEPVPIPAAVDVTVDRLPPAEAR